MTKNIYDSQQFFDEYAEMDRSKEGLKGAGEWGQFQELFPDLTNLKVLDVGCGYGWHSKYAADNGAKSVFAFDGSVKMIERAKKLNSDPKITYQVQDLETYAFPAETFDLVISNLVLHYIEDLEEIYKKINRTLTSGGIFLLNIEHPIYTSGVNQEWTYGENGEILNWPIDNYFYTGQRQTMFLGQHVTKQHHTLTQILNGLLSTGFVLETVEEARPPQDMLDLPGMKDELRRPMMLLIRAKKV